MSRAQRLTPVLADLLHEARSSNGHDPMLARILWHACLYSPLLRIESTPRETLGRVTSLSISLQCEDPCVLYIRRLPKVGGSQLQQGAIRVARNGTQEHVAGWGRHIGGS